ncbi:MAG: TRAP transporter permease [Lawsonibacter sp.]|nr:TRAP transporter permease [Lawsonibacter sp.]
MLEKHEKAARTRKFGSSAMNLGLSLFCFLFTLYHLAIASGLFSLQNLKHHAIHVGLILILSFVLYPAWEKASRKKIAWYDCIFTLIALAEPIYVFARYDTFISTGFKPSAMDLIMGTLLVVLVLEATRRISGAALPILCIIFLLYGMFGRYVPIDLFRHRGYTWASIIKYLTTDIYGIYGSSIKVSATYIVMFIIFGEVMNKCGMGRLFNDLASAVAGGTKGGPAKVGVIASGLLGMINGAAVAVVVTTGSFTIPLMKKNKYSDEFAGAVVATASVGGQLMPPIMGAAAFVMAETLGVKYAVIVTAAIIPAIVYYSGILFQVQLRANKDKMYGLPKDQLPKVGAVLKERGHLIIPIAFLVLMMFLSGWTVLKIAFWSILITIAVAELRPISRMSLKDIYDAFAQAAKSTVSVAISCACVGIIVGVCSQTGFALNIASAIISIGQNAFPTIPALSLFLTLLFTMVTCMILGMGLPSIPSYLITATIAAPALIQLGVPDLAAHMFCFYFAMFANLTPPVALASFAAAGISGGNPMKTGWVSVKLAIAGFIVPYMFVYNQGLLLYGVNFFSGAWILFTSVIGVALISVAAEGFLFTKVPVPVRALSAATSILLISSEPISDVVGLALFAAIVLFQRVRSRQAAAASL